MSDPLAGKRKQINEGELESLLWPDAGGGPPVTKGDIFKLRSCHIEITKVHRVMPKGKAHWRAEFTRYEDEKPRYLHTNPAREPTHSVGQGVRDGQLVDRETQRRYARDARAREQNERIRAWEEERQTISDAISRLKRAGLGNGELFIMEKRMNALDRKLRREAA